MSNLQPIFSGRVQISLLSVPERNLQARRGSQFTGNSYSWSPLPWSWSTTCSLISIQ
uniref:Uncharacterized protein n=1 Tax=Anguilla anguilla TaxID=7936 RepID=A0A0E9PQF6_ANGAN